MTRFDVVSVFPEFFSVLDLSLIGKARERGILEIHSHDLRDWTDDPHRTVDDTPAGGGAGMVMRADIWGRALDDILSLGGDRADDAGCVGGAELTDCAGDADRTDRADRAGRTVLAIPTPSGKPLTQRDCERFAADFNHVVIACGRYEGIDARVAAHYAGQGVTVHEYSLGDYVLNGGEVAAVALIEAVGRLLPGMVGNPESLVEESHGAAGLLEYPVFTRPVSWKDEEIPSVLLSGDHGAMRRWRRDRAIEKTAARRPDLIEALDAGMLDKKDKRLLATLGYLVPQGAAHPVPTRVREATEADIPALVELAARTFPDAAPDYLTEESIRAFIAANLSAERFAEYVRRPEWLVMVLSDACGRLSGYTLSLIPVDDGVAGIDEGAPIDACVDGKPRRGPLIELSKFYIDRSCRGTGASGLLFTGTRRALSERVSGVHPEPYVWLGTNAQNRRAHNAYKKLGFVKVGKRQFRVGEQDNVDVVFALPLNVT